MRFIHPEFLWFLFFALVPVILFFLNLQKVVKVDFTNVNFINELKKETSNRFKLKRVLVMLARVLFVVFITLAFAQPTLKQLSELKAKHHIVYFDNSLSMTRKVGEGQLIDQARLLLERNLSETSRDKYSLITNSDLRINKDFPNKLSLLKELSTVRSSNAQISLSELSALVRRKNTDLEKELVIVSDFQESYFKKKELELLADTSINPLRLKLMGLEGATNNLFVDSVWVENKYLNLGSKIAVQGRVVNNTADSKDVLVKCFSGTSQLSSVVVKVKAGEKNTFVLETPLSKSGALPFKISLEDPLVSFDNDYHFVLHVGKQIGVVVLSRSNKSYTKLALLNEPLFNVKSFGYQSFNSSELQNVNLLVLENIPDLRKLPVTDIKKLVSSGGNVLFIPSEKTTLKATNDFLKSLGISAVSRAKKQKLEVDTKLLETDPFYEGVFENTNQKILNPWYVPLFTSTRGKAIIKSRIGTSFLTRERIGSGNVYLLNTTLVDYATNFHKHSLFVPTSYLIAMASRASGENLAYFTSSTPWLLKGVNPSAQDNYLMVNERVQYVPEQTVKRKDLELVPEQEVLNGVYDIRSKTTKLTSIAVNYGREESYLKPLNLSFLEGKEQVDIILSNRETEQIQNDEEGFSWWKWLILVALFWLLVETVVIRFFK